MCVAFAAVVLVASTAGERRSIAARGAEFEPVGQAAAVRAETPEDQAIAFLAREVPRWPAENGCYSCHNNGDAARALYVAQTLGYRVDADALRDTTDWLRRPADWDDNQGDPGFSDKVLARVQFASALLDATGAAPSGAQGALIMAGDLLARDQRPDGSWRLDASDSIGSPATYGTYLATASALRVLRGVDRGRFADAVARGDGWLRDVEVKTVLDAAAVVLGLGSAADRAARDQRERCLALIVEGQAPAGGWGAYLTSPTEPFDTAVVTLALLSVARAPELLPSGLTPADVETAIRQGRTFLLDRQLGDGSWTETTRPPGQESYAQYISTSGWATLALLESRARN